MTSSPLYPLPVAIVQDLHLVWCSLHMRWPEIVTAGSEIKKKKKKKEWGQGEGRALSTEVSEVRICKCWTLRKEAVIKKD